MSKRRTQTKVALGAGVLVLAAVAWRLGPGAPPPEVASPRPSVEAPRLVPRAVAAPETVAPSDEPVEPAPPEEEPATTSRRCSPGRPRGDLAPVVLELTGAPAEAAKGLALELAWEEAGKKHRHFIGLREWSVTLWPCVAETEVRITKGRWRLPPTRVPTSGSVRLALSPAPPRQLVRLTTRTSRGEPVAGVSLRLEGCERAVSLDGGVAETECDALTTPRPAFASRPWRLSVQAVPGEATALELTVLRADEVEPGKIGLGFSEADGALRVSAMAKGGPAERAGLQRGDELLEVDGAGVRTTDEAKARIIGAPGVPVRLKVRRGVDVLLIDVVREP